jgi:hypothetical protein
MGENSPFHLALLVSLHPISKKRMRDHVYLRGTQPNRFARVLPVPLPSQICPRYSLTYLQHGPDPLFCSVRRFAGGASQVQILPLDLSSGTRAQVRKRGA